MDAPYGSLGSYRHPPLVPPRGRSMGLVCGPGRTRPPDPGKPMVRGAARRGDDPCDVRTIPCYDARRGWRTPPARGERLDSVVLLLNADYEPLNVCDLRRAFRLVFGEKA